jgi:hypothetical protein
MSHASLSKNPVQHFFFFLKLIPMPTLLKITKFNCRRRFEMPKSIMTRGLLCWTLDTFLLHSQLYVRGELVGVNQRRFTHVPPSLGRDLRLRRQISERLPLANWPREQINSWHTQLPTREMVRAPHLKKEASR